MVWGNKKNGQTETTEPEPEPRSIKMDKQSPELGVVIETAERFLQHAIAAKDAFDRGTTFEDIKNNPESRRLKRASLDLSSELIILRKAFS